MGVLIVCGLSRHRFSDDRGSFFWARGSGPRIGSVLVEDLQVRTAAIGRAIVHLAATTFSAPASAAPTEPAPKRPPEINPKAFFYAKHVVYRQLATAAHDNPATGA